MYFLPTGLLQAWGFQTLTSVATLLSYLSVAKTSLCDCSTYTLFGPSGVQKLFFPSPLLDLRHQEEAFSLSSFFVLCFLTISFLLSYFFFLHFFLPTPLLPSFLLLFSMSRPIQFSIQCLKGVELQQEDVHGFLWPPMQ